MINRTAQTPDTEIARRLPAVERAVRDMKNKQFMGGDNLVTDILDFEISFLAIAPGQDPIQVINLINDSFHNYYISELGWALYINTDLDANHHWPDGSALRTIPFKTPIQINLEYDQYRSDELVSGIKAYQLYFINNSGTTNDYYFHFRLMFAAAVIS